MTDAVTTLHIAPRHFWLIVFLTGLIALSLLTLVVLRQVERKVQKTPWDHLSNAALTGWITAGLLWSGLLLLAIQAAYSLLWPWAEARETAATAGPATLGAGALVVALLGAPWVIWGTWLKHRTVGFQKEGHMTDRISKAVEQLGAEKTVKAGGKEETQPNIEVRIGGLLALGRLAEDSMRWDRGRDYTHVMQIICTYLRQNSPAKNLQASQTPFTTKTPRLDVQVATDVLCRRTKEQRRLETRQRYRLDLRGVDFDGIILAGGDFSGALMIRCRFEAADLSRTNLTGARLHGSLLNFANLAETVMRGTRLDMATYSKGNFLGFARVVTPSITIQGAEMTALWINLENAMGFFGSKDTQFDLMGDDEILRPALREAERLFLEKSVGSSGHPPPGSATETPREYQKFLHWNPYSSDDFAQGAFLAPWQKHHNLTGWPFED